ncbi:MAG: SRPBCC family protein, partial [Nocardioidaceae bacterium]
VKDRVKEKLPGMGGDGGGQPKTVNIIEDIDVGVPVSVAYNQWTQFQEFSEYTKGVEEVKQEDEVESTWKVKVFKSGRRMTTTVTEQIPDRRIAWESDGEKGTTKGVVTFHPLADDLTKILMVLEYTPRGFMEKTGNIWRAGGRRARLDLKHFRRFLTMQGEETDGWRGEIRDSEVSRTPEEVEEEESGEDRSQPTDRDQDLSEDEYEGAGEDEEPEAEYEDEYEEGEYEEPEAEEEDEEPEAEEEEYEEEPPRRRRGSSRR